jgi:hypothetical protein
MVRTSASDFGHSVLFTSYAEESLIPSDIFRGFSQVVLTKNGMITSKVHSYFLPHLFQFIMHQLNAMCVLRA